MKNNMKYKLICIAPDGAYVTEGRFDTVEKAWDRSEYMGSRWFFYPIHIVTGEKKIVSPPDGMSEYWIGRNLSTLIKRIQENPDDACDWVNGNIPCPFYFP